MLARRTSFIALIYDPGDGVYALRSAMSLGVIGASGQMIGYVYMNTSTYSSATITWQKSADSGETFSDVTHAGDNAIVYDDVVVYGSETGRYRGRTYLTISNLEVADYALYRIKAEYGGDTHYSKTFDFSNPA